MNTPFLPQQRLNNNQPNVRRGTANNAAGSGMRPGSDQVRFSGSEPYGPARPGVMEALSKNMRSTLGGVMLAASASMASLAGTAGNADASGLTALLFPESNPTSPVNSPTSPVNSPAAPVNVNGNSSTFSDVTFDPNNLPQIINDGKTAIVNYTGPVFPASQQAERRLEKFVTLTNTTQASKQFRLKNASINAIPSPILVLGLST